MKNVVKKYFRIMLVGLIGFSIVASTQFVSAYEDNDIGFSYTIRPKYGNTNGDSRHRSTTNNNNMWKVSLDRSDEGKGTITTFWLEGLNWYTGDYWQASSTHDVHQHDPIGSGIYYYDYYTANNNGDDTEARLSAENNNYSTGYYNIYGHWDEETGVIKR
ncbi:DUF2712 domain-containing protein [Terrilactibacillus laevilacticus]|uniref:DUF2712 domain-containing protein n=1 Tax=Terrilactibacillus laevilacticus TaxID=1380157 RepID=UPI001146EB9F|nr:DUF2712 domain-containing protein [Terrilactibacillus laevilacticus]